jgi:hypothetical protein
LPPSGAWFSGSRASQRRPPEKCRSDVSKDRSSCRPVGYDGGGHRA